MSSNDPMLRAYRDGVAVMRSRDVNNPTSWMYQANMHGTMMANPMGHMWNRCLHGSGQFLPWHRGYVYFFERMVRSASGNPNFALPYWDYSAPGGNRLPDAFRNPANSSNSLYNSRRNGSANSGGTFPFTATTIGSSIGMAEFLPSGNGGGFGAGNASGTFGGALESQPHNVMHVSIGGDMGGVNTAGQDPIFWMHHCNIDRLWEVWLNQPGRSNPTTNATWMNARHEFMDENGNPVSLSNAEILDTTSMGGRGYEYDSFAVQTDVASVSSGPAQGVTAAETGAISLGGSRHSVDMQPGFGLQSGGDSQNAMRQANYAVLVVEGAKADNPVGAYYEIYVNLPAGTAPDPQGIYYAGVLDYFSAVGMGHGQHGGGDTFTKRFDLTTMLGKQKAAGVFTNLNAPPKLTFVANGMAMQSGGSVQVTAGSNPVIGSARIEVAN